MRHGLLGSRWWLFAALGAPALLAPPAAGQDDAPTVVNAGTLSLGAEQTVSIGTSQIQRFDVTVDAAGMLTVVVRGSGGDAVLEVRDADNQPVRNGQSDQDLDGVLANEQLVVALPYADRWRVLVHNIGEDATRFRLVAGFVPFEAVAQPPDEDGRPSKARELAPGAAVEDKLDAAAGDGADWYRVTAKVDGRLFVYTKGDSELDLGIDVVTGEEFDQPVTQGDMDMEGLTANEGVVVPVHAGQAYYLRIHTVVDSAGQYKLGCQLIEF